METFWFFQLQFRRAYNSAYHSDFRFSLGHKLSYDSDYDSDSDSVASENQPLGNEWLGKNTQALLVGSVARPNQAQTWSWNYFQESISLSR